MSESGGILNIVSWVIIVLSTVIFMNYEFFPPEDGKEQSFVARVSTNLVNTAAAKMVDKTAAHIGERFLNGAVGAQFAGVDADAFKDKEVEPCQQEATYEHYCMSYNLKTQTLDPGNIAQGLPQGPDVNAALQHIEGCYIKGNPFQVCVYTPDQEDV